MWLAAVIVILAMAFIPCASEAAITNPELNRTYPYSTHLGLEMDWMPDSTTCELILTWNGDASGHPDGEMPAHTYAAQTVSPCSLVDSGEYYFDVDFNGLYYVNFTHYNATEWAQNLTSFYVDRSEVEGSKVIGAMLYSLMLLGVCLFIYKAGSSLEEDHWVMSILYSMTALVLLPFAVHTSYLVLQEYIKVPVLSQSYEAILVVLLWAILYVTGGYLLLQFIIKLVKKVYTFRKTRRGDPSNEDF